MSLIGLMTAALSSSREPVRENVNLEPELARIPIFNLYQLALGYVWEKLSKP